jgi:UrcA family protein
MLRTITTVTLLTLAVTAAHADDAMPSVNVAFGDLNLSRPADAQVLAERLQSAAISVCRNATDGMGVAARHVMHECVSDAINVALARIAAAQTRAVKLHLADARAEP